MNREIKFRAWYGNRYGYFSLGETNRYPSNVMSFPVQQFTGHKDKNGKEIFDGDILKFFDKIVAIVVWSEFGGWSYQWIDKIYINVRQRKIEPFFHNINLNEVVGNIYENPELLK